MARAHAGAPLLPGLCEVSPLFVRLRAFHAAARPWEAASPRPRAPEARSRAALPAARATPPNPAAIVGAGAVSLPSVYAVDAVDPIAVPARTAPSVAPASARAPPRSEEHTSELQYLMRHSYAVFCLKKKNK